MSKVDNMANRVESNKLRAMAHCLTCTQLLLNYLTLCQDGNDVANMWRNIL